MIRPLFFIAAFIGALTACAVEKDNPGMWTLVGMGVFFVALLANWGELDER